MENITIEKTFKFDQLIEKIDYLNVDDKLRCKVLDDNSHAIKTINVNGVLFTPLGEKHFKEDVEVDVYAPFDKQIDLDKFDINLKDYSYSINNKTLTVYMVLSINGLIDKTNLEETKEDSIEVDYDEIINSMNNINDIKNVNDDRLIEKQEEVIDEIKTTNKEANTSDYVNKTWATDLFKLTDNYSVFKVIDIK